MAYLHARSGIARSGVTYCGWTPPNFRVYINGTDRTSVVLQAGGFTVTETADAPASMSFMVRSITPSLGQSVAVFWTTPNEYVFRGTLLEMTQREASPSTSRRVWACVAPGEQWLVDRNDRPLRRYNGGVNTIVAQLLADYTDGGFAAGYVPSSLGDVDVELGLQDTVWGALQRLARTKNATLELTSSRRINLYDVAAEADLATVTEADIIMESLDYRQDRTQTRNRTITIGRGSTIAEGGVGAGATSVPVQDTSPFSESGGDALAARSWLTYTGKSIGSGPGSLTGVTSLTDDLAEGDSIRTIVETVDAAAQATLAAELGGGLSGQATTVLDVGGLSRTEQAALGAADLEVFAEALPELAFAYKEPRRHLRVGRIQPVSLTSPVAVSGDFIVQSVTTVVQGMTSGATMTIRQSVTLARFLQSLNTFMQKLR